MRFFVSVLIKVLCSPWWPNRERIFGVVGEGNENLLLWVREMLPWRKQLLQQKQPFCWILSDHTSSERSCWLLSKL